MEKERISGLVSIIVPVYNTEKYLRKCVESILNQTYKNIKLYLIDDGSDDMCPQMCDEFAAKDNRVVVVHKKNEGQGVARNVALDLITEGYVAFVDSDDYIKYDMLELMVDQLEETNSDMAICGTEFHGIKTQCLGLMSNYVIMNNEELIKAYLLSSPYIGAVMWNKLYRVALFDYLRFPAYRASEDSYILPEIFKKCNQSVHIGKCLYVQNVRNNSTELSKFSEKNLVSLDVAEKLMSFINKNYPQYYFYVAAKRINKLASLMIKIRQGFVYKKYKDIYDKLETMLNAEYKFVNDKYPDSIKRFTHLAVKHKYKFKAYCFYIALKYHMGNIIRQLRQKSNGID